MADNKNAQDQRDRSRVDSKDPSEVEYLHRQHPEMSHQQVKDAIEKYGPKREDIENALSRTSGGR